MINIYTDGAHSSKTNVGGWAIVITQNDNHIGQATGWEANTTNNRMELRALLEALKLIYQNIPQEFQKAIYSDSAYIVNCFSKNWYKLWQNNGWRTSNRSPVANQDLWSEILYYYDILPNITIEKVSGHSGDKWNELADTLAVEARAFGAKTIQESEKNDEKYKP